MIMSPNVLTFRTSTYARNIYLYGVTTLISIPVEYYIPVEIYGATNSLYGRTVVDNALVKGFITQLQHDETIAYIPLPTPSAPIVSADDGSNIIIGIDNTMEYAIDGAVDYVVYNAGVLPDLSGDHSVNVRVSAIANVSHASLGTTLTFTTNL